MTPSELTDDVLKTLRREFFPPGDARAFFQQRDLLRQAIAYPAKYLNDNGGRLVAAEYRKILLTVIGAIKKHGDRGAIEWFARYFATCVQSHMRFHGTDYLAKAKDAESRSVGALSPGAIRELRAAATRGGDNTVPVLAEAHRVLSARGRIRKGKKAPAEADLFGSCKPSAKGAQ